MASSNTDPLISANWLRKGASVFAFKDSRASWGVERYFCWQNSLSYLNHFHIQDFSSGKFGGISLVATRIVLKVLLGNLHEAYCYYPCQNIKLIINALTKHTFWKITCRPRSWGQHEYGDSLTKIQYGIIWPAWQVDQVLELEWEVSGGGWHPLWWG